VTTAVVPSRSRLVRRGLRLEYATLGWNVVGTVVVLIAGIGAGSVALLGFGFDSAIEILASAVVVWQLRDTLGTRERPALLILGVAFLVLAIYVTGEAMYALVGDQQPEPSWVGIAWTAATVVVMLALARGKAATGRALGNRVLTTEGRVTLVDACLAGSVLAGLLLTPPPGFGGPIQLPDW
jgi:divalent metal cation (Fe/Co/Zn/Cd) transporter